tara:strand:+ start:880 stop:1266 length:387 start_codon:yes stop_codon:yes gene_type:complete
MAHFAQLDDSNVVLTVNVIADEDCLDGDTESEAVGIAFCKSLWGADTIWKQTSYNNNTRKQYAEIGGTYDASADEFVALKPFASWTLDGSNDWTAPLVMPVVSGKVFAWDESAYQTDNTTGWIETTLT